MTRDALIDSLHSIRRGVDALLREVESSGPPPPQAPVSSHAELSCKHQWVLAGFGSDAETCAMCGTKKSCGAKQ